MSEHDSLSRLYRQLPAEEPSATLDAQVLGAVTAELAATREQRARWQRRWRYHVPLATAATLVLAVALLLRQPGGEEELLKGRSPVMAPGAAADMAPDMAAETSAISRYDERMATDNVDAARELRVLAPPPPPPVPVPAPPLVIESPAMAAMPAPAPEPAPTMADALENHAPPVMGIVADRALKQAPALGGLLKEAPGMTAQEFCTRLRALWSAGETTVEAAPECPTTDGKHQWPVPLAVAWEVNDGRVIRAEERR